jgi:hypothetical protein
MNRPPLAGETCARSASLADWGHEIFVHASFGSDYFWGFAAEACSSLHFLS